jgi:hypothetical protein
MVELVFDVSPAGVQGFAVSVRADDADARRTAIGAADLALDA